MRYVMRIARLRNHQNFERTLRFQEMPGSMLGWVSVNPTRPFLLCWSESEYDVVRTYLCLGIGLDLTSLKWVVRLFCHNNLHQDYPLQVRTTVIETGDLTFGRCTLCMLGWCAVSFVFSSVYLVYIFADRHWIVSMMWMAFLFKTSISWYVLQSDLSSVRIPAEFKHITKRRKRN